MKTKEECLSCGKELVIGRCSCWDELEPDEYAISELNQETARLRQSIENHFQLKKAFLQLLDAHYTKGDYMYNKWLIQAGLNPKVDDQTEPSK